MEAETPNSSGFLTENKSLLLDEIKGHIINTSRSIAAAQREIKINGINQRKHDVNPIANFYYYFNNLFLLTRDLVKDENLKKSINMWLNTGFYNTTDSNKILTMFTEGVELYNKLDAYLYHIGIKDTNKTGSTRFPFGYYYQVLEEKKKNANA